MIYFTADEHYFHKNIIKYCDRPWKDEKDMRRDMIALHNDIIKPEDTVFHIGDFAMLGPSQHEKISNVMGKLNGINHLILGNHDECKPFRYVECGFWTVHTAHWFEDGKYKFALAHDPCVSCTLDENQILLCGHVHTLFTEVTEDINGKKKLVINVGVDARNFKPISLQEIIEICKHHSR